LLRDEEAAGSNPATPTRQNESLSDLAEYRWGPDRRGRWFKSGHPDQLEHVP
jgi:hypothetical protein